MKYLVKTEDYSSLEKVDYERVVFDSVADKVYVNSPFVDLGLPSKLKWAKCNVGASTPEETGLFFQWGDTQGYTAEQVGNGEGKKAFSMGDYKFSVDGSSPNFSKYNATDSKKVLDLEDDAVRANMGGNWRMPTLDDYKELFLYTDIYLVPTEGEEVRGTVQGMKERGTDTSSSVTINWESQPQGTLKGVKFYKNGDKQTFMFVPAGGGASDGSVQFVGQLGVLWSSSLYSSDVQNAWSFGFNSDYGVIYYGDRYDGAPVRGVLVQ